MKNITKKQFKNLFVIFSLLLVVDYPLLPFLSSLLLNNKRDFCEDYSINTCLFITLSFTITIIFFWCMAGLINYSIFFMKDYRNQKFKIGLSLPIYLYIKYTQKSFRDNKIKSYSVALILVILCFGIIYLFLRESLMLVVEVNH